MSNSIRSSNLKRLQRLLDTVSLLLNQVTANDESAPIESIMTMHTDFCLLYVFGTRCRDTFSHDGDEAFDIGFGGWNFSGRGEFMVGHLSGCERRRIVRGFHAVGDVDDMADIGVLSNQVEWGMNLICLSEGLTLTSNSRDDLHRAKRRFSNEGRDTLNVHPLVSTGYVAINLLFILETPFFASSVG